MKPGSNLNLSNPNTLISRPFNTLVYKHFRISQVVELRLFGDLIMCCQTKNVTVRTLQDL